MRCIDATSTVLLVSLPESSFPPRIFDAVAKGVCKFRPTGAGTHGRSPPETRFEIAPIS